MTIDPNTQIAVTLNAAQWNTVLVQIAEGPYKIVAPLLIAIQSQCQQHDPEANLPVPNARGANGAGMHNEATLE